MPRILIVEHEDGTGPGFLGTTLAACDLELDLRRPYRGEQLPDALAGYHGLVVLGGTPNPYDDAATPWLPAVRSLLHQALTDAVPTLGICLGGELLAMVAGGEVRTSTHGVEVGVHELTLTDAGHEDPLFGELPQRVPAVEWHIEEITTLPPGAVPLCSSEQFPNQAFRVGPCAWGTQFHPEVLTDMAAAWASSNSPEMRQAGLTRDDVVAQVSAAEEDLKTTWGSLAHRWALLVHEEAAGDKADHSSATAAAVGRSINRHDS